MKIYFDIIFWILISTILILIFGISTSNFVHAFYFASFFIPIVIATSWVFNKVLIPKYLLKKRYSKFILYTFYTLVVSLNLEMTLVFVALLLLGFYDSSNIKSLIANFRLMPVIMYLIVFISGFISLVWQYFQMQQNQEMRGKEQNGNLIVRANRQNKKIKYSSILYIESMADYVRIFISSGENVITRENISNIVDKLPNNFLRIHRSYVINLEQIESYTKEYITINGNKLPISRTYRNKVNEIIY